MSQQIKRKPVPGQLIIPGHWATSSPSPSTGIVESPSIIQSPMAWSTRPNQSETPLEGRQSSNQMPHPVLDHHRQWSPASTTEEGNMVNPEAGSTVMPSDADRPPRYAAADASPAEAYAFPPTSTATPIHPRDVTDKGMVVSAPMPNRSKSEIVGTKLQYAYGEMRHFTTGLITHPHESTKHYSILQHSPGLVCYSGHYTSLALTVFSDRELPNDRTFWLQRKGFSGSAGMQIGTLLGTRHAWLNITPAVQATANDIKASDERAYQRDIARFRRKASKKIVDHVECETCILRIPCESNDGYLRVVMCSGEDGKKTLCSSPLFRLFSTSTDSSSIRGSPLRTLPFEVGLKVASTVANRAASAAVVATAGLYVATAKTVVGTTASSVFKPSGFQQQAMSRAFDHTVDTVAEKVDQLEVQVDGTRDASYQRPLDDSGELFVGTVLVGDDGGPQKPYPVRFSGTVVEGTGNGTAIIGVPTANLTSVNSDIILRYAGVYFGWASINLSKKAQESLCLDDDWHEALIYIIPCADTQAGVVQKKIIKLHLLEDFEDAKFYGVKIYVIMMGCLRPVEVTLHGQEEQPEIQHAHYMQDSACAMASLARPEWGAETILARVKSDASQRSMTERYIDMRQNTSNSLDKVPMHKLGVRTVGAVMRDRLVGNGGVWIKR